jgi:hypothetical protein
VRLLFALPHAAYLRNFESTLRLLAAHGHEVMLAMGSKGKSALKDPERRLAELAAELPGLVVKPGVERIRAARRDDQLGRRLRSWLDYMRYFDEGFERATQLRARAAEAISPRAVAVTEAAAADPTALKALRASVGALESRLPVSASVRRYVGGHAPDAVIVSPLMQKGAPQTAYLRAAHELGIPCGLCVASWDNMTTSTLIHGAPDLVTVWNSLQVEEAVRLHGVPRERVAVIGAPLHDLWFDTRPATSRAEFCARVGLPDDRPYILYVGSSPRIAPAEETWIVRWVTRIRAAGSAELARASVLVRPHPHNPLDTDLVALRRLEGLPGVAVHPRRNDVRVSAAAHQEYFDAIHHAAAVVGVNTSAMIEAAIVGRGIHVVLSKHLRDGQEGRPHFDYLVSAGGGLLRTSETIPDHVEGLARAIRGEDALESRERAERFLRAFVRPHGLETPVTPLMVDALESLAGRRGKGSNPPRSILERAEIELGGLEELVSPPTRKGRWRAPRARSGRRRARLS